MSVYKICIILKKFSYAFKFELPIYCFICVSSSQFTSLCLNFFLFHSVAISFTCLTDYVSLLTDSGQLMMSAGEEKKSVI